MPTKISRNARFIEKQKKIGNKFTAARPRKGPVTVRPKNDSESVQVATSKVENFDYMSMVYEIKRRIDETDDVLVALQALDFLEELELIDERAADLLADYVEKAFETLELDLNQLNFTIDKLESMKLNTEMMNTIIAQLQVVADNIQGRLDGIVQGSYTACDALADAATGAALGIAVVGPIGAAGGTTFGAVVGTPAGGAILGTLGGAAGAVGGAVAGAILGVLAGWAARTHTEASKERKEEEKKEKTGGTSSQEPDSPHFNPDECFPIPMYFQNFMS